MVERTLDGRRALVVGGYGGLGSVIAAGLAAQGASVAVAGRSEDRAIEFAEKLAAETGSPTAGHAVDVTNRDECSEVVERVAARWSGLDIAVNCAGRLITSPAEDFAADDWRAVVDATLSGAFWLSQAVGRVMIRTNTPGRLVHLSSVRAAAGGRLGFSAYGSAKAGLNLLVAQLATEWGRHGITVNAVAPGFVRTELVAGHDPAFVARMRGRIPLGRFAEPEEIAGAVLYLVSPTARFTTGQVIYVDGGVTASQ